MRLKKSIEKTAYDDNGDDYWPAYDRTEDSFHGYSMREAGPYPGYDNQENGWNDELQDDYRWQEIPKDNDDWQNWDEDPYSGYYGGKTREKSSGLKIPRLGLLAAVLAVAAIVVVPKLIRNNNAIVPPNVTSQPAISFPVQSPDTAGDEIIPSSTENTPSSEEITKAEGIVTPAGDPYAVDQSLLFYRTLLNDEEKQLYDHLCNEIIKQPDTITGIHARSCVQLNKIFRYIQADHPDYFWVSGEYSYTYLTTENGIDVDLTLRYEMDIQQRRQMQERIDGVVDYIQLCLGNLSEYEKVKGVYEYLINNSVYDLNNGGQTICPILVEGRGVCASYAKSTQYLLQKLGVQVLVVTGTARGDGHAWNVVRIDGDYYQVDTTWGDPVSDDGSQTLTYTYFCLTSQEMYSDHTPCGDLPVPDCTATACNYFRKEGRMASAYDENWLLNLIRQDIALQQDIVFRASDANVYYQYCDLLINQGGIFRILEQLNATNVDQYNVSHYADDQFFVITLYLNYL